MEAPLSTFRSAFITIVGRPNCGKSTLLNTVLGEELSIVSTTPQTTRRNLKGIYNAEGLQIVFVDTPGIHRGGHALNKAMLDEAVRSLSADADAACYMVDLAREFGREEDDIAAIVSGLSIPRIILFNKKDICDDPDTTARSFFARYPALSSHPHRAIVAKEPAAKDIFLGMIDPFIPLGHAHYPVDDLTDANTRFFAAEFVRKQILYNTHDEVPHSVFVEITGYRESPGRHHVDAVIYVETDGQKGIVVGSGGKLIKKIQQRASEDLHGLPAFPLPSVVMCACTRTGATTGNFSSARDTADNGINSRSERSVISLMAAASEKRQGVFTVAFRAATSVFFWCTKKTRPCLTQALTWAVFGRCNQE